MLSWGLLKIFAKYLHLWKKTIYFYDFDRHEGAFYVHITVRDKSILYEKKCIVELFAKKIHRKKGSPGLSAVTLDWQARDFAGVGQRETSQKLNYAQGKIFENFSATIASSIGSRYIFIVWLGKKMILDWMIDHYHDFF